MEIKKDPGFVRPPKIVGEPLLKNQHKYCAYHEANGHTTEGCITLRLLIEKHIGNGRLVKFLVDQRDHRDHNPVEERQPRHLVFLIDTSGSMDGEDRLGLVKRAFLMLLDTMDAKDRVSIVTYASREDTLIEYIPSSEKTRIMEAITGFLKGNMKRLKM